MSAGKKDFRLIVMIFERAQLPIRFGLQQSPNAQTACNQNSPGERRKNRYHDDRLARRQTPVCFGLRPYSGTLVFDTIKGGHVTSLRADVALLRRNTS